jgi:hypothetical protein
MMFSETDLSRYLLLHWWTYDDSRFKSAAPTNSPLSKATTAYIVSPLRNVTNAVTKDTIKPKKSAVHSAPLADAYANSLSFSRFSCLLLARVLSLLDTLLNSPLLTLMLSTFREFGGTRGCSLQNPTRRSKVSVYGAQWCPELRRRNLATLLLVATLVSGADVLVLLRKR